MCARSPGKQGRAWRLSLDRRAIGQADRQAGHRLSCRYDVTTYRIPWQVQDLQNAADTKRGKDMELETASLGDPVLVYGGLVIVCLEDQT